jgi:Holliday junction resolvasome RuvABC ATP-dependent DNA helicase subunit
MSSSPIDRYNDPVVDKMTLEQNVRYMRRITDGYAPDNPTDIKWIGQPHMVAQIKPFLHPDVPFPHTLLLGEPGLGKTHMARWIASQRGEGYEEHLAPVVPSDLPLQGIVLIDEIHLQRKPEPLFKAMEEVMPTIMGATTRPEIVDKAFRSRFFLDLHLHRYTSDEMKELIALELEDADEELIEILSTASAGNPRQALKLAKYARMIATGIPEDILVACRITADGLTDLHLKYLEQLRKTNKPTGLTQITAMLYSDETTTRNLEPLLLDYELIELNSNGRTLSRKGTTYVKGLE